MNTPEAATTKLQAAWPGIVQEARATLGSELYYQALVYHHLRSVGVPLRQLGMNVKMWISKPVSPLFRKLDERKHERFRGGFEPIPDVAVFSESVNADWRRRNNEATLTSMLLAVEVKASERANSRLRAGEIESDIRKLAAHRDECAHRGSWFYPVMMVLDTAPMPREQMTRRSYKSVTRTAEECSVGFLYCSPDVEFNSVQEHLTSTSTGPLAAPAVRDE